MEQGDGTETGRGGRLRTAGLKLPLHHLQENPQHAPDHVSLVMHIALPIEYGVG
jgi:hypothetical protein